MYARGMTVREIQGNLEDLYGVDASPALISRITDTVMEAVKEWQARPLDACYPLIFFDAIRVKIRDEGFVRNKAVYIALGIQPDGTKEVLGIWIEQTEGAKFWMRVMTELKNRGVADILIAVVDWLKGFPDAITAVFPKTVVQTCVVHLIRQSMSFASWKDRKEVARALRAVYRAADETAAWDALNAFEEGEWGQKYPPVAQSWRRNWEHVIPFFAFPEAVRRIIYTTDEIDKTFVPIFAIPSSCGRPRGEAWRVGWKRHRTAQSVPAGLRRPHTRCPCREDVTARQQRSARSSFPRAPRPAPPVGAVPLRCRHSLRPACYPSFVAGPRPVPWRGACGRPGWDGPNGNPRPWSACASRVQQVYAPRQRRRSDGHGAPGCG